MTTDPAYLGTHPAAKTPRLLNSGTGERDISTKTLLLAARPDRGRFTIQNNTSDADMYVYVGDAKHVVAQAGGGFDDSLYKGAVYVEGEADQDFAYEEISI